MEYRIIKLEGEERYAIQKLYITFLFRRRIWETEMICTDTWAGTYRIEDFDTKDKAQKKIDKYFSEAVNEKRKWQPVN